MILLTGATGLLGSHILTELLRERYPVKITYRKAPTVPPGCPYLIGDLMDVGFLAECMADVTHVIHTAGKIGYWKKEEAEMYQSNVLLTGTLVNYALEQQVSRFLHISSVAALPRGKNIETNEEMDWKQSPAASYYGLTKHLAEKEVLRGQAEGLETVICNPAVLVGGAPTIRSSYRVFDEIFHGLTGFPSGSNGFVSASDVAKYIVWQLQGELPDTSRLILSAEHWSYHAFFNAIADALNKRPPSIAIHSALAAFAGIILERVAFFTGKAPRLSASSSQTLAQHYRYDNSRWLAHWKQPLQSVQDSIHETANYYFTHLISFIHRIIG